MSSYGKQQKRLAGLRDIVLSTVPALKEDAGKIPSSIADLFTVELRVMKLEVTQRAASRPTGLMWVGPGWEGQCDSLPAQGVQERDFKRQLFSQVCRGLGSKRARLTEETAAPPPGMLVSPLASDARVLIGRDRAGGWQCVVRVNRDQTGLLEARFLRADEEPTLSSSRFAYWRKHSRALETLLSEGRIADVAGVWRYCSHGEESIP
jgi:hypothetical protein